jgi:PhoH-like ATPase
MKAFVLDTNTIIDDPECLNNFDGRLKVLPITVIEELDRLKRGMDERAANSRKASRIIKEAVDANREDIVILIEKDLDPLDIQLEMMALEPDDLILLYYKVARDRYLGEYDEVVLVTNDNNMYIKAKAYGFTVENIKRHAVEVVKVDTQTITLPEFEFTQISYGRNNIEASDYMTEYYENQYIVIASESSTKQTLLGKVLGGKIVGLNQDYQEGVSGVKPKNKEQRFFLDALCDPSIDLVIVNGSAGAGKTLLSMAIGLNRVIEGKKYDRMIITKPTYAIDNEIGHLPGTLEEKMMPWLAPYQDNLEYIVKRNKYKNLENLFDNPYIEVMALTFIRGRSIMNAFTVIDECQNIPPSTIKTIVSRAGQGSKLVLLGDTSQIDNPNLNKHLNGLSYAINKLKGHDNIACLQMSKSFRSRLAQQAVDIL